MESRNQDAGDLIAALSREVDAAVAKIEAQQRTVSEQLEQLNALQQQVQQGNQDNVMLALGSGYFVERTRSEALEFLQRQIESLTKVKSDLTSRVAQVKQTKDQLVTFLQVASQTPSDEDKLNEDGLPFMDIVEQLDDDDNVILAQVNNQNVKPELLAEDVVLSAHLIEPFVDDTPSVVVPADDSMDIDSDDVIPDGPKIRELSREDINSEPNLSSEKPTESDLHIKDGDGERSEDSDFQEKGRLSRQFSELLEDMELVLAPVTKENLLSKINTLDIDPEHKQQLLDAYHRQFDNADEDMTDVKEPEVPAVADDTFDESTQKEREQVLADIIKENFPEELPKNEELHGKNDGMTANVPSVDTLDLLELEILADDFNGDEDEWDGDWPFDEDEDEEYADDDNEDMFTQPQFFRGNNSANDMLWKQVMERRQNLLMPKIVKTSTNELGSSSSNKKKSVRFAPELEIKEVENISDELKQMKVTPKVSLFKQRRLKDDISVAESLPADLDDGDEEMLDGNVLEELVVERFDDNSIDDLAKLTILERPQSEAVTEEPRKVSRFKQQRQQSGHKSSATPAQINHTVTHTPSSRSEQGQAEENEQKSSAHNSIEEAHADQPSKEFGQSENSNQKVGLDYHLILNDLDMMARAYALGLYDDDIDTEGPVVEEPHDFELINEMVELMGPDFANSKTANGHSDPQYDSRLDEVGDFDFPENESTDDDDYPILADEIVEHDITGVSEDPEDLILQLEISSNYHRLRQKLLFDQNGFKKLQQELEMEPIDAEGNPIKVSRFKAARLGKA